MLSRFITISEGGPLEILPAQLESCFCLQSSVVVLSGLQNWLQGDKAEGVTSRILALLCLRRLNFYIGSQKYTGRFGQEI
jgi:hypothetical protein